MFEFMICFWVFMIFFSVVKSVNEDKEEIFKKEFQQAIKKKDAEDKIIEFPEERIDD